jgi:PII-like signaling protein
MEIGGQGVRVRVYFGESDHAAGQSGGKPLWSGLLEYLRGQGAAGAVVTRGVAGFGAHLRIHTFSLVSLSSDLPLVLEWVDSEERVERLLPGLCELLEGCGALVTSEVVRIRHYQAHMVD